MFIIISYNKPILVSKLIKPYSKETLPDTLKTSIYFSANSNRELEVISERGKKEIITLISNMKVREQKSEPKLYVKNLKETYDLHFNNKENEMKSIYILNKDYIRIDNKCYKIISSPDLSRIYYLITTDQLKGVLDEITNYLLQGG